MKKSRFGKWLNYSRRVIKNLRIPSVKFTNPEMVDAEPTADLQHTDFIVIKCPLCKERYSVPSYTVDFVCNSRVDGEGCRRNRMKYFDQALQRYKEVYQPYYFMI